MIENIVRTPNGPRSEYCRLVNDAVILIEHPQIDSYEVDLADLHTSGGLAERITHLAAKPWTSPALIADFASFASALIMVGWPLPRRAKPTHDLFAAMRAALE
jgi:hypothetical protein